MRIYYDREADVLAIDIVDIARDFDRNEELPYGDAVLDLAEDGRILGIEILNASKKYPLGELTKIGGPTDPISLTEAAGLAGTSQQALRKACERGALEGRKIGRNWVVSLEALNGYLDTRVNQGPRAQTGR